MLLRDWAMFGLAEGLFRRSTMTRAPRRAQITWDDLKAAEDAVGDFGSDNRAGVQGTLHRISAMRSRKGTIVGLTCRVGRAVTGHVDMIRDILDGKLCLDSF